MVSEGEEMEGEGVGSWVRKYSTWSFCCMHGCQKSIDFETKVRGTIGPIGHYMLGRASQDTHG